MCLLLLADITDVLCRLYFPQWKHQNETYICSQAKTCSGYYTFYWWENKFLFFVQRLDYHVNQLKIRQLLSSLSESPRHNMEDTAANQLTFFYLKQQTEREFWAAQEVKLPTFRSHEPSLVRGHQIRGFAPFHWVCVTFCFSSRLEKWNYTVKMVEEVKDCISFPSFKTKGKMKREPLNNNGFMLTLSIIAEGFPGPHDPEDCVEMTSSLVSHGHSSKGLTN